MLSNSNGAVMRRTLNKIPLSPYFKAIRDYNRAYIKEYERLRNSLMFFKVIDWTYVIPGKVFDSSSSS